MEFFCCRHVAKADDHHAAQFHTAFNCLALAATGQKGTAERGDDIRNFGGIALVRFRVVDAYLADDEAAQALSE